MTEIYPWHAAQWRVVAAARAAGRLPHALLLAGPPGLGKQHFAMRVAAALLCTAPGASGDACGTCRGCRHLAAGSHPDFTRVRLLLKGESLDGKKLTQDATQVRIDQVRELGAGLALSAQFSGAKVAVIDPADLMNRAAANALLKTLEEPTPETLIVLVAARPWLLPATVRSRCQTLLFRPPDSALGQAWLGDALDLPPDRARALLAAADGRPLAALGLADSEVVAGREAVFKGFAGLLGGRADPLALAAGWCRDDPRQALDWVAGWLVDLARLRSVPGHTALDSSDLAERLQAIPKDIDLGRLFRWLDQLQRYRRLLDTPVNAQLTCEDLLLGWDADLDGIRGGDKVINQ